MAKFKLLLYMILAGLVLPIAVTAQTITLSQTGNVELDGTYSVSENAGGGLAYTKTTAGTTYQISQYNFQKNNTAHGWIITNSKGNEYFAVHTGPSPLPAPPADGWDVGRAGVGLNVSFALVYNIPASVQQTNNPGAYSLSFTNTVKTSVSIFPNPTTGILNILTAKPDYTYTIRSLTGKLWLSGRNSKIDITALPAGVYILTIEVGKEHIQKKIIKS